MTFLHVYKVIEANEFEVLIEKIFTILLKKYIKGKWKRKTARPTIILEITYNIFYDVLFQFNHVNITLEENDLKFT